MLNDGNKTIGGHFWYGQYMIHWAADYRPKGILFGTKLLKVAFKATENLVGLWPGSKEYMALDKQDIEKKIRAKAKEMLKKFCS